MPKVTYSNPIEVAFSAFIDGLHEKGLRQIPADGKVAQLLLLPNFKDIATPISKRRSFKNTGKKGFWQTVINDERSKLKLQVNGIKISGFLGTLRKLLVLEVLLYLNKKV